MLRVYKCERGHVTATKINGFGMVAWFISCRHEGCREFARISYDDPEGSVPFSHEWRPATAQEIFNWTITDPELASHAKKGGLILYEVRDEVQATP